MKGWQIFVHSVRQVFGNLNAALRVSGVLFLVQIVASFGIGTVFLGRMEHGMGAGYGFSVALIMLVSIVMSLWIAVGWHRYVLRVELPGLVPAWHGGRMLAYFGVSLLIGLTLLPFAIVFALIGAGFSAVVGPNVDLFTAAVGMFLVLLPAFIVSLRLSAILPGVALGQELAFSAGWKATKGETPTFAVLTVVVIVAALVIQIPARLFGEFSLLGFIWSIGASWVQLMVGVSLLTTLYGHYIEKRPLV